MSGMRLKGLSALLIILLAVEVIVSSPMSTSKAKAHPSDSPPTVSFYEERILRDDLDFWQKYAVDIRYGGFISGLNRTWGVTDTTKHVEEQWRTVAAFSMAYLMSQNSTYLDAAKQGYDFLMKNAWDVDYGGWYWQLYQNGTVKDDDKGPMAQIFAVYGLTMYYLADGSNAALEYAKKTFDLFDARSWDAAYLGYMNNFYRNWTVKDTGKTFCYNVDAPISFFLLYDVTKNETYLSRIEQLVNVLIAETLHPTYHCTGEAYYQDWTHNPHTWYGEAILIGHNNKFVWALTWLYEITHNSTYLAHAEKVMSFAMDYAWDSTYGDFYNYLYRNGTVEGTDKEWWQSCSSILALLLLYKHTGNDAYWDLYQKSTNFLFTYIYDSEYGGWYTSCYANGTVKDSDKGNVWKGPYHDVELAYMVWKILLPETETFSPVYVTNTAFPVLRQFFANKRLTVILSAPTNTLTEITIYPAEYGMPTCVYIYDTPYAKPLGGREEFDEANYSCWYYDDANNLLYVKAIAKSSVPILISWEEWYPALTPKPTAKPTATPSPSPTRTPTPVPSVADYTPCLIAMVVIAVVIAVYLMVARMRKAGRIRKGR